MDYPPIFGNSKKTQYLLELLQHEPCSGRELSRICGIDHQEEHRMTVLFSDHQVIERLPDMRIRLNTRFVAGNELRNYLYALLDKPVAWQRQRAKNDEGRNLAVLLGFELRTKILVSLAKAANGLTTQEIARRYPGINVIGGESIRPLVRDRLVIRKDGRAGRIFINREVIGFEALVAFLNRLGDEIDLVSRHSQQLTVVGTGK